MSDEVGEGGGVNGLRIFELNVSGKNDKFQHFKEMCVSRSIKRYIYIFPQTDSWLRGDLALTNTYTLQFKKKKEKLCLQTKSRDVALTFKTFNPSSRFIL